jgi:hypothetical protein
MNVDDYVDSFVDRDMVMRYFGGGIGHLKNAPPLEVPGLDSIDPSSKEMAVEDDDDDDPCKGTNEDLGTVAAVQQPSRDVVMNGGELVQLEVGEDDEVVEDEDEEDDEDSDGDEGGNQTDEDEDEDEEGEDDYGYACP